jgi:hypothetical protein
MLSIKKKTISCTGVGITTNARFFLYASLKPAYFRTFQFAGQRFFFSTCLIFKLPAKPFDP